MGARPAAGRMAAITLVVVVLVGCGSTALSPVPAPTSLSMSAMTAAPVPSRGAVATAILAPGGSGSAMPTSAVVAARCLSGVFSVVYPPGDNPVRSACLHMGTTVSITLMAIRGITWSKPTDSNLMVAAIIDQVDPSGTRHDSVLLLQPGTVTFTSASSYTPDPQGPPSRPWSLTLTIVP